MFHPASVSSGSSFHVCMRFGGRVSAKRREGRACRIRYNKTGRICLMDSLCKRIRHRDSLLTWLT